jgi:hypothetical protein
MMGFVALNPSYTLPLMDFTGRSELRSLSQDGLSASETCHWHHGSIDGFRLLNPSYTLAL